MQPDSSPRRPHVGPPVGTLGPDPSAPDKRDWVDMWAASSVKAAAAASGHHGGTSVDVYDDDFEDDDDEDEEEEETSLSSVRGSDSRTASGGSRRRLPATPPQSQARKTTHKVSNPAVITCDTTSYDNKTDDYLKDTISLMASMEARMSATAAPKTSTPVVRPPPPQVVGHLLTKKPFKVDTLEGRSQELSDEP